MKRCQFLAFLLPLALACDFSKPDSGEQEPRAVEPKQAAAGTTKDQKEVEWKDIRQGKGDRESEPGTVMTVHYKLWLEGEEAPIEDSRTRGKAFTFTLGDGSVIQGWDHGLLGMKAGGTRKLTIPPELAYGKRGISGLIPPDSTLVFEIELKKLGQKK